MSTTEQIEKKELASDLAEHLEWLKDFKLNESDNSISFDVSDKFLDQVKLSLGLDREPTQQEVESLVARAINLKVADLIKEKNESVH